MYIFSMANEEDGGSFNQYLKRSNTNRFQAARLFGVLLGQSSFSPSFRSFSSLFQYYVVKDD